MSAGKKQKKQKTKKPKTTKQIKNNQTVLIHTQAVQLSIQKQALMGKMKDFEF